MTSTGRVATAEISSGDFETRRRTEEIAAAGEAQAPIDAAAIADLSRRGDWCGALRRVLPHLGDSDDSEELDVNLAALAMQAFLALGIGRGALEIAARLPDSVRTADAIAPLVSRAETGRSGVEPAAISVARFRRNVQALRERGVDLGVSNDEISAWLAEWRQRRVVLRDLRGNLIFATQTQGRLRDFSGLGDDRGDVERFVPPHAKAGEGPCPPPYLFVGSDSPLLIERIWRETSNLFNGYSPRLYVLEPSFDSIAARSLFTIDLSSMLADERVIWRVGAGALSDLCEELERDRRLQTPKYVLTLRSGRGAFPDSDWRRFIAIADRRAATVESLRSDAQALFADRDVNWWRGRYDEALGSSSDRPLRVMLPVSRYSTYLSQAAAQLRGAFERIGCEARLIIEADDHSVTPADEYLLALRDWRPDLVVQIDHLSHELRHIIPANLPCVSWIQDRLTHLFNRAAGENLAQLEIVVGLAVEQLVRRHGFPQDQCEPMLNGCDPSLYSSDRLPDEELEPHRCDIAYVSNHSDPPDVLAEQLQGLFHAGALEREFLRFIQERVRELFENETTDPTARLNLRFLMSGAPAGIARSFTRESLWAAFDHFALPLADRWIRHQTLDWVIDDCRRRCRTLRLYGRGWEKYEKTAPYAAGVVRGGRELRAVYQAAGVNLHMSVHGSLHQRVFDGFAAGGFVLCRRTRGDLKRRQALIAQQVACEIGRNAFRTHESERLTRFMRDTFGPDISLDDGWNLDHPNWRRHLEASAPCDFASFDALVPGSSNVDELTFWSRSTLAARLDNLLPDRARRDFLAAPVRDAVVQTLSVDAIARRMIELVRARINSLAGSL